ncbi:hypothetical protein VCHA34P112_270045 [Vibrio chagasii]|nr:hypothetical protein VCHA34P112_270045 [Vibrio chagasii]
MFNKSRIQDALTKKTKLWTNLVTSDTATEFLNSGNQARSSISPLTPSTRAPLGGYLLKSHLAPNGASMIRLPDGDFVIIDTLESPDTKITIESAISSELSIFADFFKQQKANKKKLPHDEYTGLNRGMKRQNEIEDAYHLKQKRYDKYLSELQEGGSTIMNLVTFEEWYGNKYGIGLSEEETKIWKAEKEEERRLESEKTQYLRELESGSIGAMTYEEWESKKKIAALIGEDKSAYERSQMRQSMEIQLGFAKQGIGLESQLKLRDLEKAIQEYDDKYKPNGYLLDHIREVMEIEANKTDEDREAEKIVAELLEIQSALVSNREIKTGITSKINERELLDRYIFLTENFDDQGYQSKDPSIEEQIAKRVVAARSKAHETLDAMQEATKNGERLNPKELLKAKKILGSFDKYDEDGYEFELAIKKDYLGNDAKDEDGNPIQIKRRLRGENKIVKALNQQDHDTEKKKRNDSVKSEEESEIDTEIKSITNPTFDELTRPESNGEVVIDG